MIHHISFKSKKETPSVHYQTEDGSFGLDQDPYLFEICRERFGVMWDHNTLGFFFKHPSDKGYSVATFLKKTEIILNQKEFSQFSLTNRDCLLWVEPSYFWKQCRMRRSLLTIMLRAGMVYDPKNDNYEEALFSEKHVRATRQSVMRFLFGFTSYEGPDVENQKIETRGWKYVFEDISVDSIKIYLQNRNPENQYQPEAEMLQSELWV